MYYTHMNSCRVYVHTHAYIYVIRRHMQYTSVHTLMVVGLAPGRGQAPPRKQKKTFQKLTSDGHVSPVSVLDICARVRVPMFAYHTPAQTPPHSPTLVPNGSPKFIGCGNYCDATKWHTFLGLMNS